MPKKYTTIATVNIGNPISLLSNSEINAINFNKEQELYKEEFITFIKSSEFKRFEIDGIETYNGAFCFTIRYSDAVPHLFRQRITETWKDIRIESYQKQDKMFVPFKNIQKYKNNNSLFRDIKFVLVLCFTLILIYIRSIIHYERHKNL